jgi:hypothetical protein
MGADLVLAYSRAPHYAGPPDGNDQVIPEKDSFHLGEVTNQRIQALDDSVLDELIGSYLLDEEYYDSLADDPDGGAMQKFDDLPEEEQRRRVHEYARKRLLDAVEDYVVGYRRDVAAIWVDGRHYLFTGGMSWGDQPTDAFDYIGMVGISGIFDEAIPRPTTTPERN